MLSPEDNSGVLTFLAGMVILVFAAVGLSLVIDRRFQFSSSTKRLATELAAGDSELGVLRERQRALSSELTFHHPSRATRKRDLDATLRILDSLAQETSDRLRQKQALENEISTMERKFLTTREQTRQRIWREAAGEEIGLLETRGGRRFEDAVIRRVTRDGLEIRHRSGFARLAAAELPDELRQRFQWFDRGPLPHRSVQTP